MLSQAVLFIQEGFNVTDLQNYIENKYGKTTHYKYHHNNYSQLNFVVDGVLQEMIIDNVHNKTVESFTDEYYISPPVPPISDKTKQLEFEFDVGEDYEQYIKILEDIGKNFCSGYLKESTHDDQPWRKI